MRLFYWRPPTAKELEGTGLTIADYEPDPVEVWPENWQAWRLFTFMQTQWSVAGMGGHIGLKYEVLWKKMDRMKLSQDQYDDLESDIREMEFAALDEMSKRT